MKTALMPTASSVSSLIRVTPSVITEIKKDTIYLSYNNIGQTKATYGIMLKIGETEYGVMKGDITKAMKSAARAVSAKMVLGHEMHPEHGRFLRLELCGYNKGENEKAVASLANVSGRVYMLLDALCNG